jgi:hypothetical protein
MNLIINTYRYDNLVIEGSASRLPNLCKSNATCQTIHTGEIPSSYAMAAALQSSSALRRTYDPLKMTTASQTLSTGYDPIAAANATSTLRRYDIIRLNASCQTMPVLINEPGASLTASSTTTAAATTSSILASGAVSSSTTVGSPQQLRRFEPVKLNVSCQTLLSELSKRTESRSVNTDNTQQPGAVLETNNRINPTVNLSATLLSTLNSVASAGSTNLQQQQQQQYHQSPQQPAKPPVQTVSSSAQTTIKTNKTASFNVNLYEEMNLWPKNEAQAHMTATTAPQPVVTLQVPQPPPPPKPVCEDKVKLFKISYNIF